MKLLWWKKKAEKRYILWVTTKHPEGGYSSRAYGWSSNLTYTYQEARKQKEKLKVQFYDIDIVETV